MIEEAYVSCKVAKLLREKGFDEPCRVYYWGNGYGNFKLGSFIAPRTIEGCGSNLYLAPTQQMAMRWLREKHSLLIEINFNEDSGQGYAHTIKKLPEGTNLLVSYIFDTYEGACGRAIYYCVENLI